MIVAPPLLIPTMGCGVVPTNWFSLPGVLALGLLCRLRIGYGSGLELGGTLLARSVPSAWFSSVCLLWARGGGMKGCFLIHSLQLLCLPRCSERGGRPSRSSKRSARSPPIKSTTGEPPPPSPSAQGCESLWSYDYGHAQPRYTPSLPPLCILGCSMLSGFTTYPPERLAQTWL